MDLSKRLKETVDSIGSKLSGKATELTKDVQEKSTDMSATRQKSLQIRQRMSLRKR